MKGLPKTKRCNSGAVTVSVRIRCICETALKVNVLKFLTLSDKMLVRPNKKKSVFRVTGLKRQAHIFLRFFFLEKNNNFMHFENA